MVKKENLFKVVSGAMILTVVSVGGVALAGGKTKTTAKATTKTSSQLKTTKQVKDFGQPGMGFGKGHGGFEKFDFVFKLDNSEVIQTALNNLITKGDFTQDKAKEVQDYLTKKAEERKAELDKLKNLTPEEAKKLLDANLKSGIKLGKMDLFQDLVDSKILTQAQADALKTQVQEVSQKLAEEKEAKELAAALNKLVEKGAITSDKVNEVQDYLAKLAAERKAEFEKIKNMTPEERAKYFATKKADTTLKIGPFAELVSANILTQDQATALANQLMEDKKAEIKQKLTDNLNALVTKGTITQEQADKVIAKLETLEKEQQALMDKLKAMTPEERMKYMQENQDKLKSAANPLDQLATEGVITADQAKAISSILPQHGPMGGKMMMPFGQPGPGGMGRGMMGSGGHMGPQEMFNKSL